MPTSSFLEVTACWMLKSPCVSSTLFLISDPERWHASSQIPLTSLCITCVLVSYLDLQPVWTWHLAPPQEEGCVSSSYSTSILELPPTFWKASSIQLPFWLYSSHHGCYLQLELPIGSHLFLQEWYHLLSSPVKCYQRAGSIFLFWIWNFKNLQQQELINDTYSCFLIKVYYWCPLLLFLTLKKLMYLF